MTAPAQIPPAGALSHAQRSGWACVYCGASLAKATDAVLAGRARGSIGAHNLDGDVYACAACGKGGAK